MLIYHYPEFCIHTIFHSGREANARNKNIDFAFEVIGKKHTVAILGFHAIMVCDQRGKSSELFDKDLQSMKSLCQIKQSND